MFVQQFPKPSQETALQSAGLNVQRVEDWLTRECPQCHRIGFVGIYPQRELEAMNFITRADWVCKPCADIEREVACNFFTRGGDVIVH